MGEVKVESHNMGPTFSRLASLSFHVNWASHSSITTFSNFDLENLGSSSWLKSQIKVTKQPIDSYLFLSMAIVPPIPVIQHFQNFTLKTQGQSQMTMMLHNYRSRQFHRTSNGINPSNGFRDVGSDPYPAWFDKLLAHMGQAHMGQMGK